MSAGSDFQLQSDQYTVPGHIFEREIVMDLKFKEATDEQMVSQHQTHSHSMAKGINRITSRCRSGSPSCQKAVLY